MKLASRARAGAALKLKIGLVKSVHIGNGKPLNVVSQICTMWVSGPCLCCLFCRGYRPSRTPLEREETEIEPGEGNGVYDTANKLVEHIADEFDLPEEHLVSLPSVLKLFLLVLSGVHRVLTLSLLVQLVV
jgi:hypothetical protein